MFENLKDLRDEATEEDLNNIVILSDENGDDVPFEFLDLIEHKGGEYIVILPVEDDDGEVIILRVEEVGGEENYVSVDDDQLLNEVFLIFKEKFQDEFDFI